MLGLKAFTLTNQHCLFLFCLPLEDSINSNVAMFENDRTFIILNLTRHIVARAVQSLEIFQLLTSPVTFIPISLSSKYKCAQENVMLLDPWIILVFGKINKDLFFFNLNFLNSTIGKDINLAFFHISRIYVVWQFLGEIQYIPVYSPQLENLQQNKVQIPPNQTLVQFGELISFIGVTYRNTNDSNTALSPKLCLAWSTLHSLRAAQQVSEVHSKHVKQLI